MVWLCAYPSCVEVVEIERGVVDSKLQSCNFSVEVPLWKVLCGQSENPSVWRWERRAVARTSKHILLFALIRYLLTLSLLYLALLYIAHIHMLDIVVCLYLCWIKRASYSTLTLNLEESRGAVPEPFTGNSVLLLVTHSVLHLSLNSASFVFRLASTPIHPL